MFQIHRDQFVIVQKKPETEGLQMTWIPVRVQKKRKQRRSTVITFICCFCELVRRNNCPHAHVARNACDTQTFSTQAKSKSRLQGTPFPNTYVRFEDAVSQLPLTAASCQRSTKVDFSICRLARLGEIMIIPAPQVCLHCGTNRNSNTKIITRNGVLMCTTGPCRLSVGTFMCPNSACARVVSPDGREWCITLEKVTTAMTHTLLRQTCEGVALGNGTLTARLQEQLKKHVTIRNAGLTSNSIEPRSVKTLLRICVLGMHLMTKEPPIELFRCSTCEPPILNGDVMERRHAVCIDGIWIGSQSHLSEPFTNITKSCKPVSSTVVRRERARPRSALIRKQPTIALLVSVLRGRQVHVTDGNLQTSCAVLRILHPAILPAGFHDRDFICGQSGRDSTHDLGERSTLHSLRAVITNLFDVGSMRNNVLGAVVRYYLNRQTEQAIGDCKRLCTHIQDQNFFASLPVEIKEIVDKMCRGNSPTILEKKVPENHNRRKNKDTRPSGQSHTNKSVMWEPNMTGFWDSRKSEILDLFLTLLEGPLPNVVKRKQLPSMSAIIEMLRTYRGNDLVEKLTEHRQSKDSFHNAERHQDLLYDNRTV